MRITGGEYGGRILSCPKGDHIRPTTDKVRLAVFNMLQSYTTLEGCCVLDAFCGTGALGLEALSRGAEQAVFIDKSKKSLEFCKDNASSLGVTNQCIFLSGDSCSIKLEKKFEVAFLDPPYHKNLIDPVLENLSRQSCFARDAVCILEMAKSESFVSNIACVQKEKIYGDTKILLTQITSA